MKTSGKVELVSLDAKGGQAICRSDDDSWYLVSIDSGWQPRRLSGERGAAGIALRAPFDAHVRADFADLNAVARYVREVWVATLNDLRGGRSLLFDEAPGEPLPWVPKIVKKPLGTPLRRRLVASHVSGNLATQEWAIPQLLGRPFTSLQLDPESNNDRYGKFTCEPLQSSFGVTLGNSLRRVLLGSLQGAAITAVRIEGATREFTNIPDVVEDVTDVIRNIKEVIFKAEAPETYTVRLEKVGPGPVLACDIKVVEGLTVLNPTHQIATLDKEGPLSMELTVNVGRGYVAAEHNKSPTMSIDTIPIDALFSPIRKVNYMVQNVRVGQQTDYDKLVLEVWTNGAVRPVDAVAFAAKILKDQLAVWINFEESEEPSYLLAAGEEGRLSENLFRSVDELELSVRTANCLQNANIALIGELIQKTEQDLLQTKNFGRKSLKEIKEILSTMGLGLGVTLDDWPGMVENWKAQQAQD